MGFFVRVEIVWFCWDVWLVVEDEEGYLLGCWGGLKDNFMIEI